MFTDKELIENLEHVGYLLQNLLDSAHDRREKATVRQTSHCLDLVEDMINKFRNQVNN